MLGLGLWLGQSPAASGIAGATNTFAPEISGVPREGEAFFLYSEWSAANAWQYDVKLDGVSILDFPRTSTNAGADSDVWPADAGFKTWTARARARAGGGTTWSAWVAATQNFTIVTDTITPSDIPDATMARTSASGTIVPPPVIVITAPEIHPTYKLHVRWLEADGATEVYDGYKALTTSEVSPLAINWTATDPAWSPALPAWNATYQVAAQFVSEDYLAADNPTNQMGVAQNWMTVAITDPAGQRYWKFNVTATGNSTGPILREIKTALAGGGANNATGKSYTWSNGFIASGSFASARFFDDNDGTLGGLDGSAFGYPQWVIIDYGVNVDLHELKLDSFVDFLASAPTAFTFGPCDAGGTPIGSPPVNATGLSWTADEIKTWSW